MLVKRTAFPFPTLDPAPPLPGLRFTDCLHLSESEQATLCARNFSLYVAQAQAQELLIPRAPSEYNEQRHKISHYLKVSHSLEMSCRNNSGTEKLRGYLGSNPNLTLCARFHVLQIEKGHHFPSGVDRNSSGVSSCSPLTCLGDQGLSWPPLSA